MEIKKIYDSLSEFDSEQDTKYLDAVKEIMNTENPMKIDFDLYTDEYLQELKEKLTENVSSFRKSLVIVSKIKSLPSVKSTEAIFI